MDDKNTFSQHRRDILLGLGATAVAGLTASGAAVSSTDHHHHGGSHNSLVDASLQCLKTGQACLNHCLSEFKNGNSEMAGWCRSPWAYMRASAPRVSRIFAGVCPSRLPYSLRNSF